MNAQARTRVLVVDDDPVVCKSFDRVLSGKGYAVVTAGNGEEALRKIAAEAYDAVFTDIKMPGMDGIAVAEQIRAQRPWLPVVIVSGYATDQNEARAKAAGVRAVLHKPLSPEMIEQCALDAVGGPQAAASAAPPAAEAPPVPEVRPETRQEGAGPPAAAVPVITLAYIMFAPLIGILAMLAIPIWHFVKWLAARPTTQFGRWGRDVALFFAAPFIGLAYIVALPFVGLGAIAWYGVKALVAHHRAT
ncbi:MAG: response regulator [Rubrivivax sp.]|nr:response regulator [Rubrivivax sp.]